MAFRPPSLDEIDEPVRKTGFVPPSLDEEDVVAPQIDPRPVSLRPPEFAEVPEPSTTKGGPKLQIGGRPFQLLGGEEGEDLIAREWQAANTPILPIIPKVSDEGREEIRAVKSKPLSIATGIQSGVADLVNSLTSPLGIATLGMGALPRAAQRVIAGAFATHMASQTPEIAQELGAEFGKPENERDLEKISNLITSGAGNTAFSALAGAHATAPTPKRAAAIEALANQLQTEPQIRLDQNAVTPTPRPQRQLGVPAATAEPFLQPGVPELASAAMREQMSPIITPGRGGALRDLRNAVEGEAARIVESRSNAKQAEGGNLPEGTPAESIPAGPSLDRALKSADQIISEDKFVKPFVSPEKTSGPLKTAAQATKERRAAAEAAKANTKTSADLLVEDYTANPKGGNTHSTKSGMAAKTVADLEALAKLKIESAANGKRLLAEGKIDEALVEQQKGQLAREAIEVATDTGSWVEAEAKDFAKLGERPLDHTKNPEVAKWLAENAEKVGIELPEGFEGVKPAPEIRKATADEIKSNMFDEEPGWPIKKISVEGSELYFEDGKKHINVLNVVTDPKFQRQGKATQLLNQLSEYAGNKQIDWGAFTEEGAKYLKPLTDKITAEKIRAEQEFSDQPPRSNDSPTSEGMGSNPARISDIANDLAKKLDNLKSGVDPKRGDLGTFNVIPKVWDAAIEVAQAIIRKGGSVADAIEAALKHIRANNGGKSFLEREARRDLETALQSPVETPKSSPADAKRAEPKTGSSAGVPMIEGDKLKMRQSAEKAQTSEIVPEPVQERIATAPESFYRRQPEAMVEEAVSKLSDAELAAVPKESNIHVAANLELMKRLFDNGKFDEGYEIFKNVSKTGTEFGQNINQFKRLKGATPFHVVKLVNEGLKDAGRDPLTKAQSEELAVLANESIKADKELEAAKERWEGAPSEEFAKAAEKALERSNAEGLKLQQKMNRYQIKTWPQMLKTFAQGNPLTPASHIANTTGNIVGATMEGGARATAAFMDGVFSMLAGKPRSVKVQPVEGPIAAGGGFFEGMKKVPGVLAKGSSESIKGESRANLRPLIALRNAFAKNPEVPTVGGKVPKSERARLAVEGTFGIAPEVMLRLLSAADKPAYETARARLIQEQVKLKKLPPERARMAQKFPELVFDKETLKQINDESSDAVFQRPSKSVNALNALIKEKGGDWGDLAFTLLVAPYRLTPWNLVRRTIQYNPLYGVAATAINAAKGNQRAAMLSAGRTIVGGLLYGAGYWLYQNGLVGPSLNDQSDAPKERLLSGEILPPGHVNLSGMQRLMKEHAEAKASGRETDRSVANFRPGDETMDLKRIGGAGGAIIQASTDIMREMEKNPDKSGTEAAAELLKNSTLNQASFTIDQSFLQGVTGILEAIQRRDATRYISGVESMLLNVGTPNALTGMSRAMRPYMVDVKDNEFKGVIQNRFGIFGADDYLQAKRDLWGEPMKQTPEGRNALLYHLFDISKNKQVSDDPVAGELYYLWRKTADKSVIPSLPERSVTINKQTYPLNNEQYARYAELVGRTRRFITEKMVENPNFQKAPDEVKITLLNAAYRNGQEAGKALFVREFGQQLEAKPERAGFKFPTPSQK